MALREYITNNFWWKLLSLLLAAFTWLTIQTGFERDKNRSTVVTTSMRPFPAVPIRVLTAPGNPNQYGVDPPAVSIELNGSETDLKKLDENELHFFVDMTDPGGQEKKVRRPVRGVVPPGFTIATQNPVNVTVERLNSLK